MVGGGGAVLRDGQRRPGSHQVVTGIMGEAAGLAQSARRTNTGDTSREAERQGQTFQNMRQQILSNQEISGATLSNKPLIQRTVRMVSENK